MTTGVEVPFKKSKTEEDDKSDGILFGYGNPLLDISAEVDAAFLEKYGLEANNAILADERHHKMYDEMTEKFTAEYVPGGATQNTIRVAQWLLETACATSFTGCIGKDKYGTILKEKATEAGVNVNYMIHDSEPTGTCAVMLTGAGQHRSLCAYLAAANCFQKSFLESTEIKDLMNKAQYFYVAGFPLTVSPPGMLYIAQHSHENNKTFILNLSAPFICQFFADPMMQLMPYVDILFGNESEALAFSKQHDLGTEDIKEIVKKMAALPKTKKDKSRIVIITQGHLPTIMFKDGAISEHPITPLAKEDIIDTNGAGDAFVGGFLAQYVLKKDIDTCLRCANYAANFMIQQSGCSLSKKPSFK